MPQISKYTTKLKKNTVLKHRNSYDCNINHPERLAYMIVSNTNHPEQLAYMTVRISVKNFDLTFRFLE